MAEPAFLVFAEALRSGKVECRGYRKGRRLYSDDDVFIVTDEFWNHVDMCLENGEVVLVQLKDHDYFLDDSVRLSIDVADYNFYVSWSESHILPSVPTPIPERKISRGGRPTVHNWAVAAAVAAAFVTENDYPEPRTSLVEAMRACFADAGSCPDKREIEKFVAAMHEEGQRLKLVRNRAQTR